MIILYNNYCEQVNKDIPNREYVIFVNAISVHASDDLFFKNKALTSTILDIFNFAIFIIQLSITLITNDTYLQSYMDSITNYFTNDLIIKNIAYFFFS